MAAERAIVVLIVFGWRRLRPIMVVMRASRVLITASSHGDGGVRVRMAQSADNAIERLQGDGEKGDEDVAAAAHS